MLRVSRLRGGRRGQNLGMGRNEENVVESERFCRSRNGLCSGSQMDIIQHRLLLRPPAKAPSSLVFGLVTVVAIPAWGGYPPVEGQRRPHGDFRPTSPGQRKATSAVQADAPPYGGPDPAAATAPKTLAEKDMDFRSGSRKARKKPRKPPRIPLQRIAENCERAQARSPVWKAGERVATVDANGERRFRMTPNGRPKSSGPVE